MVGCDQMNRAPTAARSCKPGPEDAFAAIRQLAKRVEFLDRHLIVVSQTRLPLAKQITQGNMIALGERTAEVLDSLILGHDVARPPKLILGKDGSQFHHGFKTQIG